MELKNDVTPILSYIYTSKPYEFFSTYYFGLTSMFEGRWEIEKGIKMCSEDIPLHVVKERALNETTLTKYNTFDFEYHASGRNDRDYIFMPDEGMNLLAWTFA